MTHPKTARADAVANKGFSGLHATKAAMIAVTLHPAAVIDVSKGTPLVTIRTRSPSVTCKAQHLQLQKGLLRPTRLHDSTSAPFARILS